MDVTEPKEQSDKLFNLSEIVGSRVFLGPRKLGKLVDLVIKETDRVPQVTTILVHRPFGYPALLIPWDKVSDFNYGKITIQIEQIEDYEKEMGAGQILLKDHGLGQKSTGSG